MATNSGADPSAPPVISGKTKRMYVRRRSLGMTPDAAMASAVANSTGVTKSAFGVEHEVSKKRLTAAERNALPDSAFADPKDRRFPMEDKAHAKNALARADQGFAGAKLKARIKRKEEKIVAKSAFGVDHAEVEKSVRERRRRIHEQNRQAAASVGRREALGAALGSPVYTAAKAPKGMRLRAVKTQAKEAFKTPLGGGGATVRGYARAKKEWQNP